MKKWIAIVVSLLCLLAAPIAVFVVGVALPAQFSETYYATLNAMHDRLKNTEDKKIVVVGNSAVAFGVDSALLESELQKNGLDYTVCNFGLYGALGTKLMLDMSKDYIGEGDIVLFAPELIQQSFSLYFSASETWRAFDADLSMFFELDGENAPSMVGSFVGYVAEKFSYSASGTPAPSSGVYASASFDARCDMKNADRAYNTMSDGADANNPVSFDAALLNEAFIDYVNAYYQAVFAKGARMYFTFTPVNEKGLKVGTSEGDIDGFYKALDEALDFPILGNPHTHVLDHEWFYDSNVHVNGSGMTVNTAILTEELFNELGCSAPLEISLPDKPEIPEDTFTQEGDNSFANCFIYREEGGMYVITGLTEEGSTQRSLVIPASYQGKAVRSFEAQTFQNNTMITEITVQSNIKVLYDGSFDGCTNLRKLILEQEDPEKLSVGYHLLDGTTDCAIYVKAASISKYKNNYTWGAYDAYLKSN